ncbi:MAG TPA: hypothetical protein VJN70_05095 [Gemmatimonadaceae bacterium]|nr:hypothetical protein [Gemmatimonadaceae bacterium]
MAGEAFHGDEDFPALDSVTRRQQELPSGTPPWAWSSLIVARIGCGAGACPSACVIWGICACAATAIALIALINTLAVNATRPWE